MRAKMIWTLGNALMLVGTVVLLYVGGLYADASYGRYAARGDTDVPAPDSTVGAAPGRVLSPFVAPQLGTGEGQIVGAVPAPVPAEHHSTVSRLIIPSIAVDAKVVEVGWDIVEQAGQQVAVWQVAEYAVGQHKGSANPGEGGNIVLAGHVGGYGLVFKDLYYVKPGDQVILYSNGEQFLYTVAEHLLVTEEGVPAEQRAANAALIAPTDREVVTMITCWPPDGPDRFTQRVVIRAVPYAPASAPDVQSSWSIR